MSVFSEIKKSKRLSETVKLPFPSYAPEVELEVKRIPPAKLAKANALAISQVSQAGEGTNVIAAAGAIAVAETMPILKAAVVGWKPLGDSVPEYSLKERDELFEYLDYMLQLDLWASYQRAIAAAPVGDVPLDSAASAPA